MGEGLHGVREGGAHVLPPGPPKGAAGWSKAFFVFWPRVRDRFHHVGGAVFAALLYDILEEVWIGVRLVFSTASSVWAVATYPSPMHG